MSLPGAWRRRRKEGRKNYAGAPLRMSAKNYSSQNPLLLLLALLANTVNLKGVAGRKVLVLAANLLLDALDPAGKELHRSATFGANHVVVIAPLILMLVARYPVVEGHFAGQTALRQQLQGAVHGGETDAVVLLFDQPVQLIGGKMVAGVQKGTQNGVALPGMFQPHALEVPVKDFLGLAHHLARDGWLIIDALLQYGGHDLLSEYHR
jgi:hypothetical protein